MDSQTSKKLNPQGTDTRFMTPEIFYELLCDSRIGDTVHPTAAEYLKINASSKFIAEVAYLNFWNTANNGAPTEEGIDFSAELDYANSTVIITVSCDNHDDIEPISLLYTIDADEEPHLNYYELLILDGDNVVYDRRFNQSEATEWTQNAMANDPNITDENGNTLFIGEPIQE